MCCSCPWLRFGPIPVLGRLDVTLVKAVLVIFSLAAWNNIMKGMVPEEGPFPEVQSPILALQMFLLALYLSFTMGYFFFIPIAVNKLTRSRPLAFVAALNYAFLFTGFTVVGIARLVVQFKPVVADKLLAPPQHLLILSTLVDTFMIMRHFSMCKCHEIPRWCRKKSPDIAQNNVPLEVLVNPAITEDEPNGDLVVHEAGVDNKSREPSVNIAEDPSDPTDTHSESESKTEASAKPVSMVDLKVSQEEIRIAKENLKKGGSVDSSFRDYRVPSVELGLEALDFVPEECDLESEPDSVFPTSPNDARRNFLDGEDSIEICVDSANKDISTTKSSSIGRIPNVNENVSPRKRAQSAPVNSQHKESVSSDNGAAIMFLTL